jgi:DNA-binding transcriptional ArsR family regulator
MVEKPSGDSLFLAIADSTRRGIMERLRGGERTVGALAEPLPMTLQAVSKHIAVLERAGLVSRRRRGREQVVRLHAEPLKSLDQWLEHYRGFWERKLDSLAAYVESTPNHPEPAPPKRGGKRRRS